MKICKVWDSEYPWDVRAEKIARALTGGGHAVHMVARNRRNDPEQESLDECTVHRLTYVDWLPQRLNAASMFPAFFNPRWRSLISRVAAKTRADIILCRDLPLLPTALTVGRRLQIPVVLDMAENYPAMIRGLWENRTRHWSDVFIRNPRAVEWVERWAVPRTDHVLVVVEESRDRLARMGIPKERITVVGNTPPRQRAAEPTPRASSAGPLEVVYLGLLEAPRGIETLIRAVGRCIRTGLDVRLTLIGDGRDRPSFQRLARDEDPEEDRINFTGYLPNAEALERVSRADVGVIPHHADEAWNSTIPNKLFDYMAAGIAVVASDAAPVQRVVRTTGCGVVFEDRSADGLARAITAVSDAEQRARYGRAGKQAILDTYHWEADRERLLNSMARVAGC